MAARKKTTEETPDQQAATAAMDTEQAEQTASAPEEEAHAEQTPEAAQAALDPPENVADAVPDDTGPKLESLSVLADRHRVPSWQQAALVRYMGWADGKMLTDEEYRAALAKLSARRLGGGRRK